MTPEAERKARSIIAFAAREHNLSVADLLGECRRRYIANARAEAMAMVRDVMGLSYPQIGELFRRDHTTVMQAVRKVNDDQKYYVKIAQCRARYSKKTQAVAAPEAA